MEQDAGLTPVKERRKEGGKGIGGERSLHCSKSDAESVFKPKLPRSQGTDRLSVPAKLSH